METISIGDARNFFAKNFDGFGDFVDLIGVEGHADGREANDGEAGFVLFDAEFSGDAGGENHNFMAALSEASGEIAGENGDAVDHGVVEIGGDDDFHAMIVAD